MSSNELMTKEFFSELKNILSEQNQTVLGEVGKLSKKVDTMDNRLEKVEENNEYLMNGVHVDRRQAGRLRKAISRRVCELLEVPIKKSDRTTEQQVKYEKYSGRLFGRCYAEIPNEGHLARSSYLDTATGNYDEAMKDIDVFVPASGMAAFYTEVDKCALAKKIAREQGYE